MKSAGGYGICPLTRSGRVYSLRRIVRLGVTGRHAFAGVFFIGAALDNVKADQKRLALAAVVLEHGEPVLFAWRSGVSLAAAPLLDRQKARLLPVQFGGASVLS